MAQGCQKPRHYPTGCPGWVHLQVGAIQQQLDGLQGWFGEQLEYFSLTVQGNIPAWHRPA